MTTDVSRAIEAAGGEVVARALIRARAASRAYLDEHRAELMEENPEHWVAIQESKVVALGLTLDELIKELEALEIPPSEIGEVVIEHLTSVRCASFF